MTKEATCIKSRYCLGICPHLKAHSTHSKESNQSIPLHILCSYWKGAIVFSSIIVEIVIILRTIVIIIKNNGIIFTSFLFHVDCTQL